MARIAGVDLPREKKILYALPYIYGIGPNNAQRILADAMRRRMEPTGPRLSPREQEVLNLLAEGLGVAAIARKMYVSESTAKTHISKIYEKLGAANRAQAIMAAIRAGLISGE